MINQRREQRPLEGGAGQKGAAADGAARQGENFGLAVAAGIGNALLQLLRRSRQGEGQAGLSVELFVELFRQQTTQTQHVAFGKGRADCRIGGMRLQPARAIRQIQNMFPALLADYIVQRREFFARTHKDRRENLQPEGQKACGIPAAGAVFSRLRRVFRTGHVRPPRPCGRAGSADALSARCGHGDEYVAARTALPAGGAADCPRSGAAADS